MPNGVTGQSRRVMNGRLSLPFCDKDEGGVKHWRLSEK